MKNNFVEQFVVPPYSVLDARSGYWLKRKREWLQITGIPGGGPKKIWNKDFSRFKWEYEDDAIKNDKLVWSGLKNRTGKSYFDPVLCEIAYSWFTCPESNILDPFAGNSISGIVAAKMQRNFLGIELREQLCKENNDLINSLGLMERVQYINADCRIALSDNPVLRPIDFLYSCPPYGNLEKYSKDPRDLSAMKREDFICEFTKIISLSCSHLKNNRFAAVLVGDYRDKDGFLCDFVSTTIAAFRNAGLNLYNEMILVTSAGSLASRAAWPFVRSRKVGKTHQNFLVFVKGDHKKAAAYCRGEE